MSKVIEKASRYYSELPPQVGERKGAFYISELITELESNNKEIDRQ